MKLKLAIFNVFELVISILVLFDCCCALRKFNFGNITTLKRKKVYARSSLEGTL